MVGKNNPHGPIVYYGIRKVNSSGKVHTEIIAFFQSESYGVVSSLICKKGRLKQKKVPKKFRHLRPDTLRTLAERRFHDPRADRYGSITPPRRGASGKIYTSIAYTFQDAQTAADIFDGCQEGYAYARLSCGTPPIQALSEKLLELELGPVQAAKGEHDVLLTASGMSATLLFALTFADKWRSFITSPRIYGGTYNLFDEYLPRLGIGRHFISDPLSLNDWYFNAKAHPEATFLFAEDDANPTPVKLDNAAIAQVAHECGKLYVCDRTIGTPILEQPLLTGTDAVIHSLSKNIGGYSDALGGAIIARKELISKMRDSWFVVMGPVMDPRVADYMLKGLATLPERVRVKQRNARRIEFYLRQSPKVRRVHATESDLIAFELDGTLEDARRVVESYRLILFAPHLGDIRTLSTHPASTTHSKIPPAKRLEYGIPDTLIRLSVGLEDPEDIIDDLDRALNP